jgi:hypothetical protein
VVARIAFVGMAVQKRLRGLRRVRVLPQLLPVVIELVGSETDSDHRAKSPGREAGHRGESAASTKHRTIV